MTNIWYWKLGAAVNDKEKGRWSTHQKQITLDPL